MLQAGIEGRMRRRSKRAPNLSESTGKIGQELPPNQLAPLVPLYPDDGGAAPRQAAQASAAGPALTPASAPAFAAKPQRQPRAERDAPEGRAGQGRMAGRLEVETQPEIPPMTAAEPQAEKSAQAPKGYVVLAIGLPGSAKRRGSTAAASHRFRATCCATFSLTTWRSSATRGWSFRLSGPCCGPG